MKKTGDCRNRIIRARTKLLLDNPFFGYLAINLTLEEEPSVVTMATDGERLFYNPDFVRRLNENTLLTIVAHEVMHCALGHIWRREERDPVKWNYAADYADNLLLKNEGFSVPNDALCDEKYEGMSAEEIYRRLPDGPPTKGKMIGSHDKWPVEGKGKSKRLSKKWRERLARAAAAARMRGKLPGKANKMIQDTLEPILDWRKILRDLLLTTVRNDFRLMPPSKKHLWRGMYLPSTYGESLKLAIGIDTSSSVDIKQFQSFLAELRGITEQFAQFELYLFFCDTAIHNKIVLTANDQWPLDFPKRNGGTSFNPVLEAVLEECPDASGLVYLTDGDGDYPSEPVAYPVIWVLNSRKKMKWGETVEMEV